MQSVVAAVAVAAAAAAGSGRRTTVLETAVMAFPPDTFRMLCCDGADAAFSRSGFGSVPEKTATEHGIRTEIARRRWRATIPDVMFAYEVPWIMQTDNRRRYANMTCPRVVIRGCTPRR